MNSKQILLGLAIVVILGGVFAYEKFGANTQNSTPVAVVSNPPPQTQTISTPPTNGLKDGTYTGTETSSMYGKAKAQVIILNGQITDVQFLEFPNDRSATTAKSEMAMPVIKQEVIQAQSANVNTVSGATQTSESFIQSIAAALSQA